MAELCIANVDHYVAKPAIQKLARLRIDTPRLDEVLLEHRPLALEVMIGEASGVGDRPHYDRTGCVYDMTSHLMQIIGHVGAGLGVRDPAAIRGARRATLLALTSATRRHGTRVVLERQYLGYADEPGVAPGSSDADVLPRPGPPRPPAPAVLAMDDCPDVMAGFR